MAALISGRFETVIPTEADTHLAQESSRQLAGILSNKTSVRLQLVKHKKPIETVAIPASALKLLLHVLAEMAEGNPVTIIPIDAELTTQQAADLLNVSRPFIVSLLDTGQIPNRKVGTHRRVLFRDVMAYKNKTESERLQSLSELSAQAQELKMGY